MAKFYLIDDLGRFYAPHFRATRRKENAQVFNAPAKAAEIRGGCEEISERKWTIADESAADVAVFVQKDKMRARYGRWADVHEEDEYEAI